MKRITIIGWPVLLFAVLILSSCAGSQMVTQQQLKKNLGTYPDLNFAVESDLNEDIMNEMADLRALVLENLRDRNLFQNRVC